MTEFENMVIGNSINSRQIADQPIPRSISGGSVFAET